MLETRQKSTVRMKVVSLIHHMVQFFGPIFSYTKHMTRTQSAPTHIWNQIGVEFDPIFFISRLPLGQENRPDKS